MPTPSGGDEPPPPRPLEDLAVALVPVAARLVGTVRDEGPTAVAEVLAGVPDGRVDALCVVLAAMVDPDRTPAELLAWTTFGPFQHAEHERLTRAGVGTCTADVLAAHHPHRAA